MSQLQEQATRRGYSPRRDEVRRAAIEGRVAGAGWPHHLRAYKFVGDDAATRDSLAMALEQSAWMSASIDAAGSEDACTLHGLLRELRLAATVAHFDAVLVALYELADQDFCWIDFVEPPRGDAPRLGR